jgi:hypothetical protein
LTKKDWRAADWQGGNAIKKTPSAQSTDGAQMIITESIA